MGKGKIAILRWESGHVPQGLLQLEQMKGNSTNPESYPFPVELVEIEGANWETIIINPDPKVLERMINTSKKLVEEGVRGITTSCGFNALYQKRLASEVSVPVFTSSLLQVPLAQSLIGKDACVGVITACARDLTKEHLAACDITDDMNVFVYGLENCTEWSTLMEHPEQAFDVDIVTTEVLSTAKRIKEEHPNLGAIVLECTDLPPFAEAIRKELDVPVFDINSLISYAAISISELKVY